jgi:hypothetical protein
MSERGLSARARGSELAGQPGQCVGLSACVMSVRWAGVARRDVVISSECAASERGDVRGGLALRWADCVRWATHLAGGGGALGRAVGSIRVAVRAG